VEQLLLAAKARRSGLAAHVTFSGGAGLAVHLSVAAAPAGLIETAFRSWQRVGVRSWRAFERAGVDLCFEIHPGEDLHDG